jgi:lipopolysaccharide export LptBFGC system permease protein LptF
VRSIFLQQADIRPSAQFFVQPPDSDYVFYSRSVDKTTGFLEGVMLCKLYPRAFPEFTVADTASLKDNVWTLAHARKYRFDEAGFVQSCGASDSIQIDLKEILEGYWEAQRSPEEQSMADLRAKIATKKEGRQPFSIEATELHSKVSLPMACVVFALAIGPLAVRYSRGSLTGMLLASIALFAYYLILSWGKVLAQGGNVSPIICAWTQNAVFGLAGIVLFIRMR